MKLYKKSKMVSYYASSNGDIFSVSNKYPNKVRKLKQKEHKGYLQIRVLGVSHRVIATCFIPNPENKKQVNHKDGNKKNNDVSNLEWSTAYENNNHAFDTGLNTSKKITDIQALEIIEKYRSGKYSSRVLGLEYGVSGRLVMRIYNGSQRIHLKNSDDGFRFNPGRPSKDYTNEKAIIANHVSNGYTYAEIAEKMGIKRTMVKFIQYHK